MGAGAYEEHLKAASLYRRVWGKRRTSRSTGREDLSEASRGDGTRLLWFLTSRGIFIFTFSLIGAVDRTKERTVSTEPASSGLACLVRKQEGMTDGDACERRSQTDERLMKEWLVSLLSGGVEMIHFHRPCLWEEERKEKRRKRGRFDRRTSPETEERVIRPEKKN